MYARGATPWTSFTAGWQPPFASLQKPGWPASTSVFTPAITPATNVPWNERSRSSGALLAPGPAKPRATITFGVVEPEVPFGNPGGYEKPVGSRNGCSWSTPSSTTATLTPCPWSPVSAANCGAPTTEGPRLRSSLYERLGYTRVAIPLFTSAGSRLYGTLTAKPLTRISYRR